MAVRLDGGDHCPNLHARRGRWSATLTVVALLGVLVAVSSAAYQARPSARAEVTSSSAGHQRMLAVLRQIADDAAHSNTYTGDGPARRTRQQLEDLPDSTAGPNRWRLTIQLAEEELRLGNEAEAIRLFAQARDLLSRSMSDQSWLNDTLYRLGVAYMRLGETQNCTLHPTAGNCILPLQGDSVHSQQTPSRQAIASFARVLENTPEPTSRNLQDEATALHLSARWLLNIAYMTVGGYPDQVPDPYVIPSAAFQSVEQIPRFTNIAPDLGLDTFDMSGGAIADDFDNDGNLDILVLRGAWLGAHGQHPNSLLRNNADGTFTDVTYDSGLGQVHYPSQTASWGDYDNDGDLDLYVGNETSRSLVAPNQLFRNNADGTFTDVAAPAGVLNHAYAKAVVWGDYDGDRLLDLYVSNSGGNNRLYRNNGNGTFTNVARELGVSRPMDSFPVWFWDFDNDSVLDLYVSAYAAGIEHVAAYTLGLPVNVELARLYRGTGEGGFEEVSRRYNLIAPNAAMGANFGDLDNDGYLDFYLGTGYPPYHSIMPSVMYRNQNGDGFSDVTYAGGFGHLQKGHGVFFADLDHDGDQDVFEQMGGAYPGDRFGNVLYENPGFGNHWITVKLVGVRSNRSAIGARIRADVVEDGTRRSIYRHVNSGGSFGANPLRQTIGLGGASRIELLEVFWPTTGLTQTFAGPPVDRVLHITEGEQSYEILALKTIKLGQ